jgi:hypothetical protein
MNPVSSLIDDIADRIWPSQDEKLKNADIIAQLKSLPSAQAMELRMKQVQIGDNLTASHNTFLSLGLALIYFTCGFAIFHDYFIVKVLSDFGLHLNAFSDDRITQLTYLLLGGGTIHIAHTYLNNPTFPSLLSQIKKILGFGA